MLIDRFGVSQRHACRVVGQHRATQRNAPAVPSDDEMALRAWLRAFSQCHVRAGVGDERPSSPAKRAGGSTTSASTAFGVLKASRSRIASASGHYGARAWSMGAMCPIRPNVLWALDFQFDQTSNGKTLKLLNVIDEFTRECPAIEVARNIDADGVVACPRAHRGRAGCTHVPEVRQRSRVHRQRGR